MKGSSKKWIFKKYPRKTKQLQKEEKMEFKKYKKYPRKTKQLQKEEYLRHYPPELVAWGAANPIAYRELLNFDIRQAYGDQQHDRRTRGSISPDRIGSEDNSLPTWEYVDSLQLPNQQAVMIGMLTDGYTQGQVARQLGLNRRTIGRYVAALRQRLNPTDDKDIATDRPTPLSLLGRSCQNNKKLPNHAKLTPRRGKENR